MNRRSIFAAAFLLAIMPLAAVAQSPRPAKAESEPDAPSIQSVITGTHTDDAVIAGLLDVRMEIPLGPADVLKT